MEKIVQAGACLGSNNSFLGCALEAIACPTGSTFRSSIQVLVDGPIEAKHCLNSGSVEAITIGRCSSELEDWICTSHASNCELPKTFIPATATCNVLADNEKQNVFQHSLYGYCIVDERNNGYCGWSIDDCSGSWHVANHYFTWTTGFCTCDKVRVGSCHSSNGQEYCAVSKDGCDSDSTYSSVGDSKLTCFLCDEIITEAPTPFPTPQIHKEILDDQKQKVVDFGDSEVKAAGIVGIVLVVLVVVAVLLCTYKKCKSTKAPSGDDAATVEASVPPIVGADEGKEVI